MKRIFYYLFISLLPAALLLTLERSAFGQEKTGEPNSIPNQTEPPPAAPAEPNSPGPNGNGTAGVSTIVDEQADSRIPEFFDLCDRIFSTYVTEDGLVRYAALRRNRLELLPAMRLLKEINPLHLMALSQEDKTAFWINVYNLCTLQLIVDNYPIQPKWYMIRYPNNSIMHISSPWTKNYFWVQGLQYNLEEIEQEFLLARTKDPRVCFVLSYASLGGGRQRNEAYRGSKLDRQLDDQVRKYLFSPQGYILNRQEQTVSLSVLFQTKRTVFLESEYASIRRFRDYPELQRAWLNFLARYLSAEEIQFLENTPVTFKMINYDWRLDEAF
ncbi:MAG: DUF547 domain-containing protein [Anaerohalosphaeraceae bacterium]